MVKVNQDWPPQIAGGKNGDEEAAGGKKEQMFEVDMVEKELLEAEIDMEKHLWAKVLELMKK